MKPFPHFQNVFQFNLLFYEFEIMHLRRHRIIEIFINPRQSRNEAEACKHPHVLFIQGAFPGHSL